MMRFEAIDSQVHVFSGDDFLGFIYKDEGVWILELYDSYYLTKTELNAIFQFMDKLE